MKTKFERFFAKVVNSLKNMGVDITANMGRIGDIITDYYGQTDIKYVAQCIKFELDRGFTSGAESKIFGIRESAETDAIADYDENEDSDEFVDQVLDEIDKFGETEVYDYYSEHRNELARFSKYDKDPTELAKFLIQNFDEDGEGDYDPEYEAYLRDAEEYEEERGRAYNKTSSKSGMAELQKLHGSNKLLTHPTGADGQWATESFPISWAISENDVATLYEYFDNGIPSRLISGDDEDDEVIPWEEQYSQEFEQDYALLTRKVAIEHSNINDALKFMLENVDKFILSPYDLYNIFVSSKSNDNLLREFILNYEASIPESELKDPLSYFEPASILDLEAFVDDMLLY